MNEPAIDELEKAIRACRAASEKMTPKQSFRLRTLLQMLVNELEKQRAVRDGDLNNGHDDRQNGNH